MSERVLNVLKERFGAKILETHSQHGDDTAIVDPSAWKAICTFLRDDKSMDFDMFTDLCGVDFPTREPRIEVVLHLYSIGRRHRIRLKARVGDEDMSNCAIDTISDLWPGASWFERETYDLLGVTFTGHPDLRRILMYPEFEGHPLLKDYPADRTQPLIPYRTEAEAGLPLEKMAPFGPTEGMAFGRAAVTPGPTTMHKERATDHGLVAPPNRET